MTMFKQLDVSELQSIQGGFDPISWAIGLGLGTLANGFVESVTGKSLSGWVSTVITENTQYVSKLANDLRELASK